MTATVDLSHATQVCVTCKARKKKCDKVMPRCGFCVRKGLSCRYELPQRRHDMQTADSRPGPITFNLPHMIPADLDISEANLYLQAHALIHATGQSADEISARYFKSIHHYLPIISQSRFRNGLITLGATPSAGFSILLVSICLATSSPILMRGSGQATTSTTIDRRSLRLAAISLFAKVHGSFQPSVPMIQAGLLLAMYQYSHGLVDGAFAFIASCARTAYAARIHREVCASSQSKRAMLDAGLQLEIEEAANTWWGMVICERIFSCDVTVPGQPLVTIIPTDEAWLPAEVEGPEQSDSPNSSSVPRVPVSSLSATNVGGFGRSAQAAWLLDQVLKSFNITNLSSRVMKLYDLDNILQAFIGTLIEQAQRERQTFCEAIGVAKRILFTLHWHILDCLNDQSPEEWSRRSNAALDTVTKMVLDIVETHDGLENSSLTCDSPSYSHIVGASYVFGIALKHLSGRTRRPGDDWVHSGEVRLQASLDRLGNHSNIGSFNVGKY